VWGGGKTGKIKHVMTHGTLDLESGEKVEVEEGKPVALVVDRGGVEHAVELPMLRKVQPRSLKREKRSGDCGRQDGGMFGQGNDCASDEGSGPVDTSWRSSDGPSYVTGDDVRAMPPAKSLANAKSVTIVDGKLLSKSLREIGVTLDKAAKACTQATPESEISIGHGTFGDLARFIADPSANRDHKAAVTFLTNMDIDGIEGAVSVGTSLLRDENDELVLQYGMLDVSDEAKSASPISIARKMMTGVAKSIINAQKIGVSEIEMYADGGKGGDDRFEGYRIWPRLGFDGVIPRSKITPTWSVSKGFFSSYGSGIPDKILSPRAQKEKQAGALTIQALYETKEGQDWWEANGGAMGMTMRVGDKKSLGWKRFTKTKDKYASRSAPPSDEDFFDLIEVEWRSIRASVEIESRNGDCGRQDGGRFGQGNDCAKEDGSGPDDSSSSSSPSRPASKPQTFPEGSRKFRDAVDSVVAATGGDPEKVWDRSKSLADTPPKQTIDSIASEQGSYGGKPLTPEAEASYGSLVDEIGRQYEALVASGLTVTPWRGEGEPYGDPPGSTKPNSNKMREEVAKTGEFKFFMTERGFGTGDATPDHPMLRETKFKTSNGEPMIANDLFRVVHDLVAHVRGGYSFSTNGEFNGMLTHASTLPESAWPALFAETFGQNAVYETTGNFAPQNAYASQQGASLIREELKRRKNQSRAAEAPDSDEPLGYQHIKTRPWLAKEIAESRDFYLGSRESRGDAPAPKKDRIKGSDVNEKGSAKNKSGDISLDESTISSLKKKAEEHNAAMREAKKPDWTHVRLPSLKAAYRRGAGAFSTSHRPGMTRDQWAMARVNAFLTLARRGRPENPKYVGDNDLLNSKHPKFSQEPRAYCPTGEGGGVDNSCSSSGFKSSQVTEKALESIRTTGGFSIHPITTQSPTTGYMVSVVPESETILDSYEGVTEEAVAKFFEQNKKQFDGRPTLHLGGWVDTNTGKVYLDLSEKFDDIDAAIDSAESTNQLAIWDLNDKKEIRKEDYDGRRKKPREARAVRLPSWDVSEEHRGRTAGVRKEGDGRKAEAEDLISEAKRHFSSLPRIDIRSLGGPLASYSSEEDAVYVDPEACLLESSGWTSQPNPVLHEISHRVHATSDPASYASSLAYEFTAEQRQMIESSVSRYAAVNGREFVAEVIAGVLSGHDYSPDVMGIFYEITDDKVGL